MRAFFCGSLLRQLRTAGAATGAATGDPILLQKRYFADRGHGRRHYNDPGFQSHGYIQPGWFAHTTFNMKTPLKSAKKLSREPIAAGSPLAERKIVRKNRKLGNARKAYEEANKKLFESLKEEGDDDNVERLWPKDRPPTKAEFPELDYIDKYGKKRIPSLDKKRGWKGRFVTDYSGYTYPGSGLDCFTKKLKAEEEKRLKKIENLDSVKDNQGFEMQDPSS